MQGDLEDADQREEDEEEELAEEHQDEQEGNLEAEVAHQGRLPRRHRIRATVKQELVAQRSQDHRREERQGREEAEDNERMDRRAAPRGHARQPQLHHNKADSGRQAALRGGHRTQGCGAQRGTGDRAPPAASSARGRSNGWVQLSSQHTDRSAAKERVLHRRCEEQITGGSRARQLKDEEESPTGPLRRDSGDRALKQAGTAEERQCSRRRLLREELPVARHAQSAAVEGGGLGSDHALSCARERARHKAAHTAAPQDVVVSRDDVDGARCEVEGPPQRSVDVEAAVKSAPPKLFEKDAEYGGQAVIVKQERHTSAEATQRTELGRGGPLEPAERPRRRRRETLARDEIPADKLPPGALRARGRCDSLGQVAGAAAGEPEPVAMRRRCRTEEEASADGGCGGVVATRRKRRRGEEGEARVSQDRPDSGHWEMVSKSSTSDRTVDADPRERERPEKRGTRQARRQKRHAAPRSMVRHPVPERVRQPRRCAMRSRGDSRPSDSPGVVAPPGAVEARRTERVFVEKRARALPRDKQHHVRAAERRQRESAARAALGHHPWSDLRKTQGRRHERKGEGRHRHKAASTRSGRFHSSDNGQTLMRDRRHGRSA
uniref:Uncharacterized protein n=1 Tax=Pyrodinium bahamense TaxID=73915 RepID=A0A7S0BBS6_9DINO